jgi:hypothetical protein
VQQTLADVARGGVVYDGDIGSIVSRVESDKVQAGSLAARADVGAGTYKFWVHATRGGRAEDSADRRQMSSVLSCSQGREDGCAVMFKGQRGVPALACLSGGIQSTTKVLQVLEHATNIFFIYAAAAVVPCPLLK